MNYNSNRIGLRCITPLSKNIYVISWGSVLLMEETGVHRENQPYSDKACMKFRVSTFKNKPVTNLLHIILCKDPLFIYSFCINLVRINIYHFFTSFRDITPNSLDVNLRLVNSTVILHIYIGSLCVKLA